MVSTKDTQKNADKSALPQAVWYQSVLRIWTEDPYVWDPDPFVTDPALDPSIIKQK
jgi:hypothetical protein